MFGKKEETEVLVVGAGPVGMLAAILLADEGVEIRLVDSEWRSAKRSYALALHPSSLELLDQIGVIEPLIEAGHRIDSVGFYEGQERRAEMSFAGLDEKYPFTLLLPQYLFEEALEKELNKRDVKVDWSHRVASFRSDNGRPLATVEKLGKDSTGYSVATTSWIVDRTFEIASRYVIGTDGHHSVVRRASGIDFPNLDEDLLMGVFEFATDGVLQNEVRLVLSEDSTNILWPVDPHRARWSFELLHADEFIEERAKSRLLFQFGSGSYPVISEARLKELIQERAPWFDAQIGDVAWSVEIRFERRLAEHFGKGEMCLAGDAAHLAPPAGVHSMNLGLQEARDLALRLVSILRREGHPELLTGYDQAWRNVWRRLLQVSGSVEALPDCADWVRRRAGRIPGCVPASGSSLDQMLSQVGLQLS